MSYLLRLLLLLPIVYLVMVVYVSPRTADGGEALRLAVPKTGKVLFWTFVLVVLMQLLQLLFLP